MNEQQNKNQLSLESVGLLNCIIELKVIFSLLKEKGIISENEYAEKYEKVASEISKNLKQIKDKNGTTNKI